MNWYIGCWKKYVDFSGRARRREYWMFILFNFLAVLVVGCIDVVLGAVGLLVDLYGLAVFLPGLAVLVRRLHDTNRSGWWILISLLPLVGSIWLLILLMLEGSQGPNQYGPDPKAA